jgi:hypothetical protein
MSGIFAGLSFSQNCTTPQLTIPPVSTCGQTTATINATTAGTEVKWYNSATSTVPIFLGNTYTTPAITANTSYWAEAYNYDLGAQVMGGKTTPSTSSSAVVAASTPWGLAFTATSSFMLESVDVFASAAGILQLELLDVNYIKIAQKSVTIPAGGTSSAPLQFTVPVSFSVVGGNSYKLVARSSPSMRRDTGSSNSFPYALGTLGSITGGTINSSNTNSTSYYFFYNWKVSPITGTCASGKVETTVTVSAATPAPTAVATQTVPSTSTLADLSVNGQNLTWYSSAAMTTVLPSTTVVSNGTTYYVTQTANGCQSTTTAVTVATNLSTSDLDIEKQIKIYPNPVSDILIIESKDKIGSISIFDLSGKLVEVINTGESKSAKINVNSYTKGKYILKTEAKNGSQIFPFIKK